MPEPLALPGRARALAREAAGDDVDSLGGSRPNCSHVIEDSDSGPAPSEEFASERVDLTEPSVLKSGEAEPVGEESASVEQSADRGHVTPHPLTLDE